MTKLDKLFIIAGAAAAAVLLYLATLPVARADTQIAKHPAGDVVRIFDTPCVNDVVRKMIEASALPAWTAAEYSSRVGGVIPGCAYRIDEYEAYLTAWEDGDVFPIPFSAFSPEGI